MKQVWTSDELGEHWTMTFDELNLLKGKSVSGQIGFCAQLKHYQLYAGFPQSLRCLPEDVREYLAHQVNIHLNTLKQYDWNGRSGRRHRQEILEYLNVQPFDDPSEAAFNKWLLKTILPHEPDKSHLNDLVVEWFLRSKIDPPGAVILDRIIKSA
jgi:hypothetical protein